jgi:hypothetical protein
MPRWRLFYGDGDARALFMVRTALSECARQPFRLPGASRWTEGVESAPHPSPGALACSVSAASIAPLNAA